MRKWILSTIEMTSSDDGIIDPNTMERTVEVLDNLESATLAFREYIKNIKSEELMEFLHAFSSANEFAEDEGAAAELAQNYIDAVFEGTNLDNPEDCDYMSAEGSDVSVCHDENGNVSISMSGGWNYQPILKTNCAMMEEEISYYFELEDWFDSIEHTYRIVFLDPVE